MANTRIDKSTTGAIENMNAALKHHCRPEPELGHEVGCVLALPFRYLDGEKFMDRSAYGHLCTNHGSKWQLDGRYFDGVASYVDCGSDPSLDTVFGSTTLTLEAWVFPEDWVDYRGIISKKDNNLYVNQPAGLFADAKGFTFIIADGTNLNQIYYKPALNQWYHLIGMCDGSDLYLFSNRKQVGTTPLTVTPVPNTDPLRIGRFYNQKDFYGLIAEVRTYSFADYTPRILSRSIGR